MSDKGFKRKLAAILSADVEGYSLLMDDDEEATVRTLTTYRNVINDLVQQYRGRIVDTPGDNILAEFTSVVDAVNCAVEIQRELAERNTELPYNRKMKFRIGVNLGDVIEEEGRIYGDGVNIAARVEAMAEAGGICVSGRAYDQVENKLGLEYEDLGEHPVKNITRPIRVFRVLSFPGAAAHRVVLAKKILEKKWRKIALLFAVTGALAVVVFGIWHFYSHRPSFEPASEEKMAFPLPDKPSIAVLPFVNLSGDPEQEYFIDGLTEEIITALSKLKNIFVIARNSTFTYKGKPVKVQKVSEELGVKYVLEGSVRKSENKVRISTQLIDALNGQHLWGERYDRDLTDIFVIQDEITKNIITTLQVELTMGEEVRLWAKGTENLDAYLKELQALDHIYRMNIKENVLARKACEEAIALDPEFARPYVTLGWTYLLDVWSGSTESPKHSLIKALEMGQKALTLDNTTALPYSLLCNVYTLQRQYAKAIEEGKKAIALNPNSADANVHLARALIFADGSEEAILLIQKATRLNPFAPSYYFHLLGHAYCVTGQYGEAISVCKKALSRQPDNMYAHIFLAVAHSSLGRMEEARNEIEEVLKLNHRYSVQSFQKAFQYKNQTDKERIIDSLRKAGMPE